MSIVMTSWRNYLSDLPDPEHDSDHNEDDNLVSFQTITSSMVVLGKLGSLLNGCGMD